jgi:hypothetical protein
VVIRYRESGITLLSGVQRSETPSNPHPSPSSDNRKALRAGSRQSCTLPPSELLREKAIKEKDCRLDSPFPTVLMVTGAGPECKENRRVRGYEGTARYS